MELGNEQVGDHYAERYNYFYRILKKKYPQITFISTLQLSPSRDKLEKADMIDPHWYVNAGFFYENDHLFDKMERGKYNIYIGEYAVIQEANMNAALAEAAFLTGVERNSDLVKMASYAPLFQNNNRKDWPTNLIWIDNQQVLGRASYYVQQMYAQNRPTYNVGVSTAEKSRDLTTGMVGFIGQDLDQLVRHVIVKDARGNVLKNQVDVNALKKMEKGSGRRWGGPMIVNLLDGITLNGGSIEFEVQMQEREVAALRLDVNRQPRKTIVAPQFILGADKDANDYFVLHLPQVVGDRKVITMNRATNNAANVDRNPGGSSLPMEVGEWYKIRVVLEKDNVVSVYLDGEKVFEQIANAPSGHYAVAGYDEQTGETIIKVVNATDTDFVPTLHINAASVDAKGRVITLSSASKTDENSTDNPRKIVPKQSDFGGFAKEFQYTFKPNSFTILRVRTK